MKIDHKKVLDRAGEIYTELKQEKYNTAIPWMNIKSDQVKAICQALCEAINTQNTRTGKSKEKP